MSSTTTIAWTEATWNPHCGCTKISPGCKYCYANDLHDKRHRAFLAGKLQSCPQYARPFTEVQYIAHRLTDPVHWRKPRRIFVNSMSDLMHSDVTSDQIQAVLDVCASTPRHTYQLLTKRAERLADFTYPGNVWLGVTVENTAALDRVDLLRAVPAAVRWLSCEPLLEPIEPDLTGISWVVVGGEKAGRLARPMNLDWARALRDQCAAAGVSFFFKQTTNDGPIPPDLMVREYLTASGAADQSGRPVLPDICRKNTGGVR